MESGSRPPEQPGNEPTPGEGPQAPPPLAPMPSAPETPPGGWEQPIAATAAGRGWEGRPLASWGRRVAATLIDVVILLIPVVVLTAVVIGSAVGDDDSSWWAIVAASLLSVLIVALVLLLYPPLLMKREGAHNGQTLGKQMMGITVVRNNGEPMGFGWSALREVLIKGLAVGIASSIIPILPWLLDVLWPLWDDENRALHDMAAQTHVVRV